MIYSAERALEWILVDLVAHVLFRAQVPPTAVDTIRDFPGKLAIVSALSRRTASDSIFWASSHHSPLRLQFYRYVISTVDTITLFPAIY